MQPLDSSHVEFTACNSKAKQSALTKLLTEFHTQNILDNPEYYEVVSPDFANFLRNKSGKAAEKGGHGKYWALITVNPKPEVTIENLKQSVEKFVNRTFAEVAIWAFEQRGEEVANIHGIHSHIFVRRKADVAPARIKAFATKDFGNLVGNEKHIDIKYFTDADSINGINYVKGVKKSEEKVQKVTMDKLWRQTVGLEDYYEKKL